MLKVFILALIAVTISFSQNIENLKMTQKQKFANHSVAKIKKSDFTLKEKSGLNAIGKLNHEKKSLMSKGKVKPVREGLNSMTKSGFKHYKNTAVFKSSDRSSLKSDKRPFSGGVIFAKQLKIIKK
ncbi:MAG: hypothetical protein IAE91_12810 [Ignavibacteriaceae bacterium]|nr:hypothetical protein [Ignavibacteriaceae bacterium]